MPGPKLYTEKMKRKIIWLHRTRKMAPPAIEKQLKGQYLKLWILRRLHDWGEFDEAVSRRAKGHLRGKKRPEHSRLMKSMMKGRTFTVEQRENMRRAALKRPPPSKASRKRQGRSLSRRWASFTLDERRKRIEAARQGFLRSGRRMSKEQRELLSKLRTREIQLGKNIRYVNGWTNIFGRHSFLSASLCGLL